ncbi:FAD-binding oxidoreductase [Alphaproteobacteria bacterium KMM 3653]|uniref:FAD-binding oxidoreductase n=1 Tax=Harenicola maris TaxID=2841044 RepID=A0AAP2G703_9RHOB|nr:FAD-binding oxidoreductase [Harenicola maris]
MSWKSRTYTGWGRVHSATSDTARPERASHLSRLMAEAPAPALGNLRSYGDACLNDGGKAIDMLRMDRILGFDPETGVLNVEGGCTLGTLARIFAPQGWLPAVMPGTGFATVGGAIANDVHGKNHHHMGSFGQHVLEITLETPKGKEVLTPGTAGFNATIGGLGQTGVIQSAKLQMLACKGDVMMVTERRAENLDAFLALINGSTASYSVGWIDATAQGEALGRGILEEGETGAGLVPAAKRGKRVPFNAPGFALSPPIVRMFNNAYFRRVPAAGRTTVKPIDDFFFPLDKIYDWNKLYGKKGFHQFQCVLPLDQTEVLREMLKKIARSALASPLAVLKRMGPEGDGMISFPMEGYTLAVDFRNKGRAEDLIAHLGDMTAQAGGRVYLAKDALASEAQIRSMYPNLNDWAAEVAKHDPEGRLNTDMTRRLNLRGPK